MRLSHVILYVPDVAQSVAFYGRAFGLLPRFVHESGAYAELAAGEAAIAFASEVLARESMGADFVAVRPDRAPPGIEITLTTDDVARAFDMAIAAGAEPVALPQTKPWGQMVAYVRDADGFLVELASPIGA